MFDSPTPIRSNLIETSGTATPSGASHTQNPSSASASKRILSFAKGEENQQQQLHNVPSNDLVVVKEKQQPCPRKTQSNEMKLPSSEHPQDDTASDCGTEISVAARRDWLKNFEKQHQSNLFRKTTTKTTLQQGRDDDDDDDGQLNPRAVPKPPKTPERGTTVSVHMNRSALASSSTTNSPHRVPAVMAPRTTTSHSATMAAMKQSSRVSAFSSSSISKAVVKKPSFATPLKSAQTRRKEEVMATDEGYASVKELSQWLASDPTSTKKKRQVRRGRNVILKSRHFESPDVIMVENNISKGAVKDRQKWLTHAFHKDNNEEDCASSVVSGASRYYAKSEIAGGTASYSLQNNRFQGRVAKTMASNAICDSQSEIITDDAASSLSVADKKDWLKNAFSGKNGVSMASSSPAKARTDVMFNRRPCQDDVASRAKMRFKERSARKLLDKPTTDRSPMKKATTKEGEATLGGDNTHRNDATSFQDPKVPSIEEDTTPVDFRAAREALVQRSKKNGNKVDIVNKVYLRKKKFEKIEEENRRMSSAQGLMMKSSWDIADASKGLPSDSFEQKLVSDIAPKKSFEELP